MGRILYRKNVAPCMVQGAVIGHELSHGFDPNGMLYDSLGKMTTTDVRWYIPLESKVERQAAELGENPVLTAGENVADLAGLSAAHVALERNDAYEGASHERRMEMDRVFFTRWAVVWACKTTTENAQKRALTDAHGPAKDRCNMPCSNIEAFHAAFDVKPGDPMYLAPARRATMWW